MDRKFLYHLWLQTWKILGLVIVIIFFAATRAVMLKFGVDEAVVNAASGTIVMVGVLVGVVLLNPLERWMFPEMQSEPMSGSLRVITILGVIAVIAFLSFDAYSSYQGAMSQRKTEADQAAMRKQIHDAEEAVRKNPALQNAIQKHNEANSKAAGKP